MGGPPREFSLWRSFGYLRLSKTCFEDLAGIPTWEVGFEKCGRWVVSLNTPFFGGPDREFVRCHRMACSHIVGEWLGYPVQSPSRFKYFFKCHPGSLGKWSNLTHIFQMGWFNHQLYVVKCLYNLVWNFQKSSQLHQTFCKIWYHAFPNWAKGPESIHSSRIGLLVI